MQVPQVITIPFLARLWLTSEKRRYDVENIDSTFLDGMLTKRWFRLITKKQTLG